MALNEEIKEGEYYRSYDKPNQKWLRHYFFTTAKCVFVNATTTLDSWIANINSAIQGIISQTDSEATNTVPSSKLFHDTVSTMQSNFQAGCNTIAAGVTSNGGTISKAGTNPTPAEIVTGIGTVRSGGDAAATDILSGKKAYVNKTLVTGTMKSNSNGTNVISMGKDNTGYWAYLPSGYYPKFKTENNIDQSYVYFPVTSSLNVFTQADGNLAAGNIKKGTTILGITGTYDNSSAGAVGNATAADVLAKRTDGTNVTFSSTAGSGVAGGITNYGKKSYGIGSSTVHNTKSITIDKGYHDGSTVTIADTNLAAGNIKYNTQICGVTGSYSYVSSDAASAAHILSGKKAFVNGGSVMTGTMPSRSNGGSATPVNNGSTTVTAYFDYGYYPSSANTGAYANKGYVTIADADLKSGNIRSGVNIFGVDGSTTVVETSGGTVTANSQLLNGYKAYSKGTLYTGTANNPNGKTIVSAQNQILNGYSAFKADGTRIDGNLNVGYTGEKTIRITNTWDGDYGSIAASGDTWLKSKAEVSIYVKISVTSSGISATIVDDSSHSTYVAPTGYLIDRYDQQYVFNGNAVLHRGVIGGSYLSIS